MNRDARLRCWIAFWACLLLSNLTTGRMATVWAVMAIAYMVLSLAAGKGED